MHPLIRASNGLFHSLQLPFLPTSQKQLEMQIQILSQNFMTIIVIFRLEGNNTPGSIWNQSYHSGVAVKLC